MPADRPPKIVLVTGASAGIGAAVAREAARRGHDLVLTARRIDRLQALADELRPLGVRVLVSAADLEEPSSPQRLISEVLDAWGGLDVLINNAGFGLPTLFTDAEVVDLRRQLEVNLVAPLMLARHALPALIDRRGTLINIGSAITSVANSGLGAYGATKAGLAYWNNALRRELMHKGVKVCLVEPGPVKTEFFSALQELAPENGWYNPLLDAPKPWMSVPVDGVARQIVRLIDRPRRRLSVPRRVVWPFRMIGGLFQVWPALGDLAMSTMTRRFDKLGDIARTPGVSTMFSRLGDILGMIKFSHTLFALPFALLGAALAAHGPDGWRGRPQDWLGILLCMATARSAAMAFNRLVDRRIDARNPRTATRHLPAGLLSTRAVAAFTSISAIGFIAATLLFLPNRWPLVLSVPVLLWLLGYSYAKRFTSLAHFWLGAALMLAPIAAWIALRGDVGWPPVLLGLAVLCWVSGFDIIYACQDAAFDRAEGLHSIPARLGVRGALRLAAACHAAMIAALVALGLAYPLGTLYFLGVGATAALLIVEHALVKPDDLSRVNLAFFQVNIVISMGLFAVGLADLLIS